MQSRKTSNLSFPALSHLPDDRVKSIRDELKKLSRHFKKILRLIASDGNSFYGLNSHSLSEPEDNYFSEKLKNIHLRNIFKAEKAIAELLCSAKGFAYYNSLDDGQIKLNLHAESLSNGLFESLLEVNDHICAAVEDLKKPDCPAVDHGIFKILSNTQSNFEAFFSVCEPILVNKMIPDEEKSVDDPQAKLALLEQTVEALVQKMKNMDCDIALLKSRIHRYEKSSGSHDIGENSPPISPGGPRGRSARMF